MIANGETAPILEALILVAVLHLKDPRDLKRLQAPTALVFPCTAAHQTRASHLVILATFGTLGTLVIQETLAATHAATHAMFVTPVVTPVVTLVIRVVLQPHGAHPTTSRDARMSTVGQTTTLLPLPGLATTSRRRRLLHHHNTLLMDRRRQAKTATLRHPFLRRTTNRVAPRHTSRLIETAWAPATLLEVRKEDPRARRLRTSNNRHRPSSSSSSKARLASLCRHGLGPWTMRRRRPRLPTAVVPVETTVLRLLDTILRLPVNGRPRRPHTTRLATCWRSRR